MILKNFSSTSIYLTKFWYFRGPFLNWDLAAKIWWKFSVAVQLLSGSQIKVKSLLLYLFLLFTLLLYPLVYSISLLFNMIFIINLFVGFLGCMRLLWLLWSFRLRILTFKDIINNRTLFLQVIFQLFLILIYWDCVILQLSWILLSGSLFVDILNLVREQT